MNGATRVERTIEGKTISFETGLMAKQANGSVAAQIGDTILNCAATASREPREGIDFFPLQVEYREKFYAAGRFPGGYFKREARPSEKEILTARMTDRPIRPLFPEGYHNEVQIMNALLCADGENEADILSMNGASAALHISDIPFAGPIGAVRVGRVDGKFVLNPTHSEMENSDLDLIYVGGKELPIMIEGSASEISETDMLASMKFAQPFVQEIIEMQEELRRKVGLPEKQIEAPADNSALIEKGRAIIGDELRDVMTIADKQERQEKVRALKDKLKAAWEEDEELAANISSVFDAIEIETVCSNIHEKGMRIDGRGFDELRKLEAQVGLLPRTHGSSLFSRGDTQALATITLGTSSDAQSLDGITSGGSAEKNFLLHYNFPPYCVGETGRIGSTSRREIGHGALAERSIAEMMPQDYPYTVRVVSEIMGSNGSSSMASICAGTLALMDAGVPLVKPVAGISIGLFSGEEKDILVTDILGAEDHCGDMDFKVAGTREGITGFQVDLKIQGLKWDLVEGAFQKAREARIKILDYMQSVIDAPRTEMSKYAPRIETVSIDPDKIGALIGPGGKNIRRITETSGAQIDIDDDGTVRVFANNNESMQMALHEVGMITAEAEVDKIYRGKVTGIKEFGAFVEILPGKDGLVHISEMADFRVGKVEDICKVGDSMWVKCIGIDDRGKIKLSRKAALAEKDEQSNDGEEE